MNTILPEAPDGTSAQVSTKAGEVQMIVLGICLLIIAAIVPKLAVLWGVGIIVLVVGLILLILGRIGRPVGGRRHYY
jgi:membrane-bound ClpP family serine protease